ncbi:MAG: amidohydrolase family protein [Saccharolobus sp.]
MKLIIADKIYVSFKPLIVAKSIVVENGIVKQINNQNINVDEVIDFKGNIIMPGFIDAHCHLDGVSNFASAVDLSNVSSIDELNRKLEEQKSQIIIGMNFDHEKLKEKRMPTRWDIDKSINDRPVLLIRVDGHSGVLNSYAIKALGLNTEDGIIKENELFRVINKFFEMKSLNDEKREFEKGQYEFLKFGVTSIGFMNVSTLSLSVLSELRKERKLKLRVFMYLSKEAFNELKDFRNDDFLAINGVKLFADGSLGSRTALLSEPYADDKNNYGTENEKVEDIIKYCLIAKERSLQISVHAIGDKALDNVIKAYEICNSPFIRIDHASIIRDDQIHKLKKIKPVLVIQPHFFVSDFWLEDRLGKERMKYAYRIKSIVDSGIDIAFSTDAPVEPINPWKTIEAAVERIDNEKISLLDSLYYYTQGSAKALMRNDIGSLLPNNKADFIVINKDPLEGDYKNVKTLHVYVDSYHVI